MGFFFNILPSTGDTVADAIAQVFNDNPTIANRWRKESKQRMRSVVRRSLGRTGSDLFKGMKSSFRNNDLNLKKKAVYSKTGVVISKVLKKVRPWQVRAGMRAPKLKAQGKLGGKYSSLIQYKMTPDTPRGAPAPEGDPEITVGVIPERRGGKAWADRFKKWQEGGKISLSNFKGGSSLQKMRGYFASLGMPLKPGTIPTAPKRPFIQKYEQTIEPIEMFQKALIERLNR